jgi:UDP-N-acetylglucosamine--N-acetylmuramyl-(pentapeptide) pyrophosphoryl-undecaprenol N-acetylglucosamine transferase
MRIIFTGGGTAGHVWPIVAICQAIKKEEHQFLYVGSNNGFEKNIYKKYNISFRGIVVGKIRNYFSFENLIDPFKVLIGIFQSFFILVRFKPDVIFSKGGYVAFPLLFWAKIFKIPTVAHESDSVLGKTNLWTAGFAKNICLGFPKKYYDLPISIIEKFEYTGIPLRKEFIDLKKEHFDRKVLLVTGGSQGSSKINNIVNAIIPELIKRFEIFHLTGKNDLADAGKFKNEYYHPVDFSTDLPQIMENADLIITRAGSTLAEISFLSKPSIVIPLATSSLDHQSKNAKIYQENRAAEIIPEKSLTPELLLSIINRLMENDSYRDSLGQNAHRFFNPGVIEHILKILSEASKK